MNKFNFNKHIHLFVLLLLTVVSFSGCELFQNDLKSYYSEYTETAAIERIEYVKSFPLDKYKIVNLPSEEDQVITMYLRNPQKYPLDFDFIFDNAVGTKNVDYTFEQLGDRRSIIKLTFSKDFLKKYDEAPNHSISGKISIQQSVSPFREFSPYDFVAKANSLPPELKYTSVQRDSMDNDANYIICFGFPDVAQMPKHKYDVHKIIINEQTLYYDGSAFYTDADFDEETGNWTYSNLYTDLSFSKPAQLYPLEENGFNFDLTSIPSDYKKAYINSHVNIKDFGTQTLSYSIKLEDDEGLFTLADISNNSKQLENPSTLEDTTSPCVLLADEESGYAKVTFTHSEKDINGNDSGRPQIFYSLYSFDTNTLLRQETVEAGTSIELLPGHYKLEYYAKKSFYIESSSITIDNLKVIHPPVYYVSNSGNDETGTGSKKLPYATIKKALEQIYTNEEINVENGNLGEIRLMSDITLEEVISILNTKKVKLSGYETQKVINASGHEIFKTAQNTEFDVSNLVFTGGDFKADNNKLINIEPGSIVNFTDCAVTGNVSEALYTGNSIVYINNADVTFKNSLITQNTINPGNESKYSIININNTAGKSVKFENCKISDNISHKAPVVAVSNGPVYLTDTSIRNNKIYGKGTDDYTGSLYCQLAACHLSGKVEIYDNFNIIENETKNANLSYAYTDSSSNYLIIDGDISESKINYHTQSQASIPAVNAPVDFTSNYSESGNTVAPNEIFVSDDNYLVAWNRTAKEAALYVSSTAPELLPNENIEIRCLKNYIVDPKEDDVPGRTVKFNVYNKTTGEDLTSTAQWYFKPTYLGKELPSSYYTVNKNSVIISSEVVHGVYTIAGFVIVDGSKLNISKRIEICTLPSATNLASKPVSGTYAVKTQNDMNILAEWTNTNSSSIYSGVEFILATDVTLENFASLGTVSGTGYNAQKYYGGTLDGNGNTITVSNSSYVNDTRKSLVTGLRGTIRNITVEGNLTNVEDNTAVFVMSSSNGIIENCVNKVNISSSADGVSGFSINGKINIINCRNEGNISGKQRVAGFVGYDFAGGSTFISCVNTGDITATSLMGCGGIYGYSGAQTFYNCINTGTIKASGNLGGITAFSKSGGKIHNCKNSGTIIITGSGYTGGGIAGITSTSANGEIKNCVNTGSIIQQRDTADKPGCIVGKTNGTVDYSLIENNFYLDDGIHKGFGNVESEEYTDACPFTSDGISSKTPVLFTLIMNPTQKSDDVVTILNDWIYAQDNPDDYILWVYDENGLPKLSNEE